MELPTTQSELLKKPDVNFAVLRGLGAKGLAIVTVGLIPTACLINDGNPELSCPGDSMVIKKPTGDYAQQGWSIPFEVNGHTVRVGEHSSWGSGPSRPIAETTLNGRYTDHHPSTESPNTIVIPANEHHPQISATYTDDRNAVSITC